MTDVFTVRLPLPPNLTNPKGVTSSWRGRHFGKKGYYDQATGTVNLAVRQWCHARQIALAVDTPLFDRAIATVEMHVRRKLDASNMMALLKWPEDLLVFCHVLRNDDPTHLMYNGFPKQITHDIRRGKTEAVGEYNRRRLQREQTLGIIFNLRAGTL